MTADFPWRREIRGTRLAWHTIREWIALCEGEAAKLPCSTPAYQRIARLYRSLTLDEIRRSFDEAGLEMLRSRLEHASLSWPPGWYLTRANGFHDIEDLWAPPIRPGEMLTEIRNRLLALRSGRATNPRPKGPRFDPRRLPDAAIDRLIQRHPDLEIVERLRAERSRRLRREAQIRAEMRSDRAI